MVNTSHFYTDDLIDGKMQDPPETQENLMKILTLLGNGISIDQIQKDVHAENYGVDEIKPNITVVKDKLSFEYWVARNTEEGYVLYLIPHPTHDALAMFKVKKKKYKRKGAKYRTEDEEYYDFYGMFDIDFQKHPNYIGMIGRELMEDFSDIVFISYFNKVKKK